MQALQQQVEAFIWDSDLKTLDGWRYQAVRLLRILVLTGRDLGRGMLTLRAMGLVYTTLLSFVPLLAVSFSVLKGFGVHNQVEPMLLGLFEPLGEKSAEMTARIVGFVENMKIGVLGALGLGMLIFTVLSLIQKIESALNYTWRLTSTRNLAQRFSNYLSVVMVGPVLVFSAIGITASLKSHAIVGAIEALPYAGDLVQLIGRLLPWVMIIGAFAFVYLLVPNTRVKVKSALYGAIIAGVIWRTTGAVFASFAGGATSYTAIYSGFAILLLFMIWLYLGWLILLIGASISYYHQHPERLIRVEDNGRMSARLRERLALQLMQAIARDHDEPGVDANDAANLAMRLKATEDQVERSLETLLNAGLIVRGDDRKRRYLPAKSIDRIALIDIINAARSADDNGMLDQMQGDEALGELLCDIDRCRDQALLRPNRLFLSTNNMRS